MRETERPKVAYDPATIADVLVDDVPARPATVPRLRVDLSAAPAWGMKPVPRHSGRRGRAVIEEVPDAEDTA